MTFSRLYLDYWTAVDYVDRISRNFKPWRLYGNNDTLQLLYGWDCHGPLIQRDMQGQSLADWGGPRYEKGKWMHVQLVYQASSPGSLDGTIRHAINSEKAGLDSNAVMTRRQNDSFNQIRIGHYWDRAAVDDCPSNGGAIIYTEDMYIDTSWARVELGNASTYTASTHREIQVPTSWADGSVSVTFHPGTFTAGTTVYLYVTDANNIISPSVPVKIGGSGTTEGTSTGGTPVIPSSPGSSPAP